jgi:hypothetical protein
MTSLQETGRTASTPLPGRVVVVSAWLILVRSESAQL